MDEAEWLACTDPMPMLEALHKEDLASERKLRLFAVACCRRNSHLFVDALSRHAVDVAELFADDKADDDELDAAHNSAEEVWKSERYGWEDLTDAELAAAVAAYHATLVSADLAVQRDLSL